MMEEAQSIKVVSQGGLNSNVNHLLLSDQEPGSAIDLLNFESSLYGGYRRISGFSPLLESHEFVDPSGAEGRILLTAIFGETIIVARKQKASTTYDFYYSDGTTWVKMTTGLSRSSVGVTKIRWKNFNFNGTNMIIFVDGVNPACIYDGTNWTEIKSANTGATFSNAGGNQAINSPSYVEIFKNHIFIGDGHLVAHSAPLKEYDWTASSGGGQLPVGFELNQIKTYRDSLIVFGQKNIKKIEVSSSSFVINGITSDIGCLASDSVVEVAGSLLFLSQDGFRPISSTDRIGDTEIETVSKKIQGLITERLESTDLSEISSVLVRGKSQVRFFFSSPELLTVDSHGIVANLRGSLDGGISWEWSRILGISASSVCSGYIGANEYIIHGTYDGGLYRQEQGSSFNGSPIVGIYKTPYLDFGDASVRKTLSRVRLFLRPEGPTEINMKLTYDWDDYSHENPDVYPLEISSPDLSVYGSAVYGSSVYSTPINPVIKNNVEGSGNAVQFTFTTNGTQNSYTIQGLICEFITNGRK